MESIKAAIVSLGCSKNQVDAEKIAAVLVSEGIAVVERREEADVVLINTCGFIESAKEEAIGEILEAAELKAAGTVRGIVVSGCLAERYRKELRDELPEVGAIIGIGSIAKAAQACRAAAKGGFFCDFGEKSACADGGPRLISTPFYTAYLKIADGCDNRCAFCAIPYIRGAYKSRPIEELVGEAEKLCDGGVVELNLIAQDTTRYGEDLYGKRMLPELLERLCAIEKLRKVRFLYSYIDRVDDRLIETVAAQPKVAKYFDLPIQHGSDRILKKMNRRDTREGIITLCKKLRERISGVRLRTTVMVGFPDETAEDFDELLDLIKLVKFDRLGCFEFSMEEGTPAARYKDSVSARAKRRRRDAVMTLQAKISELSNQKMIGRRIEVLCEGFDQDKMLCVGRSDGDAPEIDGSVYFKADIVPAPGDFVAVTVERADMYDLYGSLTD